MAYRPGPLAVALAIGAAGFGTALATDGGSERVPRALLPAAGDRQSESGPASHVSFLQKLIPPPPTRRVTGPATPRSLADLARRLPLERAVAQLFLVGFDGKDATAPIFEELRRLDLGGVVLDGRNYDTPQQLSALAGEAGVVAGEAKHVPPWVMAEQDGGDLSRFENLPPAKAPGEYGDAATAAAAMTEAITALKALGINGLLEPDLDIGPAEPEPGEAPVEGPLGKLTLSGNPGRVAEYARAVIGACRAQAVFCAPKHFPGIGSASNPTDEGPAQIGMSLAQLEARDVRPFAAAAKAGAGGMVIGEGLYEPDSFVTPAALSKAIIGGLLRKRLRFGGLAITDDLADPGVSTFSQVPDAAVEALAAGADMIYISGDLGDQEAAYNAVLNAVRSGRVPEARVRQALLRILSTKRAYGLLR